MSQSVVDEEYYIIPQEEWDEKKCLAISKRYAKDGCGTRYHFPGYIGSTTAPVAYGGYGSQRYNGGCFREGKHYAGETRLLPKIPDNFEIVMVPTWGYRIIKKEF